MAVPHPVVENDCGSGVEDPGLFHISRGNVDSVDNARDVHSGVHGRAEPRSGCGRSGYGAGERVLHASTLSTMITKY
jgi:hypothetical protein